jgi:glycosyltransferase involved in cell wall biosynthesis
MPQDLSGNTILHVDAGREWRGGQRQVLTLCRGLRDRGIGQVLVTQPTYPLARRAAEEGIEVVPLRMRGEFDIIAAWRVARLVAQRGARLVHAHDAHAHAVAWLATRRRRDTVLLVSRRVDFPISRNLFSRRKYLDPRIRFLAISNGVREVLLTGGVAPAGIQVVPSGVDPSRFTFDVPRDALRAELGIPADAPIVGTIGSLVDHKDHACLIDALPKLLERVPNARLVIVGEGELRPALERRIAEKNLTGHVALTGHREDIEMFLSGFDAFAVSSHLEGLNTSLIDAMLFALPTVGTRTGGIPDLIHDGETGLLVEPKSPEALGEALARIIQHPDWARKIGENGRRHARAHFTAEALVEGTVAAYLSALAS